MTLFHDGDFIYDINNSNIIWGKYRFYVNLLGQTVLLLYGLTDMIPNHPDINIHNC